MLAELREFFTLAESERAAQAVGEAEPEVRRLARLVAQRTDAAEVLARARHHAEAERLADDAIGLARTIVDRFSSIAALLDARATDEHTDSRASDRQRVIARLEQPPSEALFDEDALDARALDAKLAALRAVNRALSGVAMGAVGRREARWQRAGVLVCAALLGALVYVRQSRIVKLTPRASAFYGAQYEPKYAVDGYLASNWLLPDATQGWLEVTFDRRTLSMIELVNVQNLTHYGTHDATIELYAGSRMVRSIDVSMRSTVGTANATRVSIGVRDKLDRIRIHVKSWHSFGGGLAEVRVQ